ncbi:hypothetical protein FHT02_003664 [Sphingomonas xinjiangensis]|uniref:Uncharacterized protein n=1 Tax=Sphingomonas xinjiangensis TaxID=643568 RepID=A0A840YRV5_9SPHN|nr:hypothetical protein [Sphingomonas xinjiangensis]
MELHGSIVENLDGAAASARRLRGHPVYKDTLLFWGELLQEARRVRQTASDQQLAALDMAITNLESELADRAA